MIAATSLLAVVGVLSTTAATTTAHADPPFEKIYRHCYTDVNFGGVACLTEGDKKTCLSENERILEANPNLINHPDMRLCKMEKR
jgi:hypothetical protein